MLNVYALHAKWQTHEPTPKPPNPHGPSWLGIALVALFLFFLLTKGVPACTMFMFS